MLYNVNMNYHDKTYIMVESVEQSLHAIENLTNSSIVQLNRVIL